MSMLLILLFLLNIAFVSALWHMDINHNLDRLGNKKTRGVFKVAPEQGYRYSQYVLIATLALLDFLVVFLIS